MDGLLEIVGDCVGDDVVGLRDGEDVVGKGVGCCVGVADGACVVTKLMLCSISTRSQNMNVSTSNSSSSSLNRPVAAFDSW